MPSFWRTAGISYLRYANLISGCIRRSLKPDFAATMKGRNRHPVIIDKYDKGVQTRLEWGSLPKPDE